MKFSRSLLQDQEIGQKIISNSIEKSKTLLTDVFGIDFTTNDPMIKELSQGENEHLFKVLFNLRDREISATLELEQEREDIVQEVLVIRESIEDTITLNNMPSDYKKAIDKVMDFLEEKYELDFTPLDPEEQDENIKDIKQEPQGNTFEVIFTHDDHEAVFTAKFLYQEGKESLLTVIQDKQHAIYLE